MVNPRALKHYIAIQRATHFPTFAKCRKCRTLKLFTLIVLKQLTEIVTRGFFLNGLF